MNNKTPLLFLLLVLFSSFISGQEKDFKSWNSVQASLELTKNMDFKLEQEFRFENNASYLGDYLTVVGISYKINKFVQVRGYYRFQINRNPKIGYETIKRLYGDVRLKERFGRFDVLYRTRYQINILPNNDADFTYLNPQHLRHKVQVAYDIPKNKIDPFVSYEMYQALNNPIKNTVETHRYSAGLAFPVSNQLDAEIYYRIEKENDLIHKAKLNYVLGIGLSIDL
jgi:hypothetical protein